MYGIVNKAIEELVVENFGSEKWESVKERSGVDVDFFISNEPYDDEVTFKLATAVSDEMNISISDVLKAFGEWWILRTGKEKYGYLMESGGNSLRDFLINLPLFHNRVMMIYPKLTPPEFKISDITENSLHVHYISKRIGLTDFVHGLLTGLGKFYDVPIALELIETKNEKYTHKVFKVVWN
ncbi:heme NO-binding protein [bacterium 336/3]|nr:heme NO-binding protein [bacterium 336/3]